MEFDESLSLPPDEAKWFSANQFEIEWEELGYNCAGRYFSGTRMLYDPIHLEYAFRKLDREVKKEEAWGPAPAFVQFHFNKRDLALKSQQIILEALQSIPGSMTAEFPRGRSNVITVVTLPYQI